MVGICKINLRTWLRCFKECVYSRLRCLWNVYKRRVSEMRLEAIKNEKRHSRLRDIHVLEFLKD